MDENVAKAVENVRRSLQANYLPTAPVHADLQTIRAHLLAREAEVDAVSTELRTMRGEFAKQFKRAERAEAVLREIRDSTFRNATTLRGMADRYLSHANQQELP